MQYSNLYDLITCLEYGNNIHICVVFLNKYGNFMTNLPTDKVIHSRDFCTFMKSTPEGFRTCYKCRNLAINKAVTEKKPFGGLCFNGIYEYCHPVVENGTTVAVICIGNIISSDTSSYSEEIKQYMDTFEVGMNEKMCIRFGTIIENYIKLLLREYPKRNTTTSPLVTNISNYVEESMYYDFSVSDIAAAFNYNEKYIGQIFRRLTGQTIKEYLNDKRIKKAKELLETTNLSVIEISAKVGFNNVTYFNRLFKKTIGMSPSEYRNNLND